MYDRHRTASRLPPLAKRENIPPEEREDYDRAYQAVERFSGPHYAQFPVDGRNYGLDYFKAFTNTPRLAVALRDASYAVQDSQSLPGTYSMADHELIDLLLGFDSGFWGLSGIHTANAVTAGVRIQALEALRDGREEELTEDERLQVEFIRAVRDGGMTDEIWNKQVERLGSVRGVIEYAFFVCMLWVHHRMMWAFGVAAIDIDDWTQMIEDYKSGARDARAEASDYVEEALEREAAKAVPA